MTDQILSDEIKKEPRIFKVMDTGKSVYVQEVVKDVMSPLGLMGKGAMTEFESTEVAVKWIESQVPAAVKYMEMAMAGYKQVTYYK